MNQRMLLGPLDHGVRSDALHGRRGRPRPQSVRINLLGIDHEKLIFRHNGINRRLTDDYGKAIPQLLA
jgi:hypothetical protein